MEMRLLIYGHCHDRCGYAESDVCFDLLAGAQIDLF
jgi:hypothetical protein